MSHGGGPAWICEHGFLDGRGCRGCEPPLRGGPVAGVGLLLLMVVIVTGGFFGVRWVTEQLWSEKTPRSITGTWCGQADEVIALNLSEQARERGEVSGELSFGGRDSMAVTGRIGGDGAVTLRTVGSALRFDLSGALVEDRLRLNVVDDAGDVGRVELRHCREGD